MTPTPVTNSYPIASADASEVIQCPHCGGANLYTEKVRRHLGIYCTACSKWIKWLSQGRPLNTMPFGKHKGTPIRDLPSDYIRWVLENLNLRDQLFKALSGEYERRGGSSPKRKSPQP
jgi:hypothetical protein